MKSTTRRRQNVFRRGHQAASQASYSLVAPARSRSILHYRRSSKLPLVHDAQGLQDPPRRATPFHDSGNRWIDPDIRALYVLGQWQTADARNSPVQGSSARWRWAAASRSLATCAASSGSVPKSTAKPSNDACILRALRTCCCLATSRVCWSFHSSSPMAAKAVLAGVVPVATGGGVQAALRLFNQAECGCDDNLNVLRFGNCFRCCKLSPLLRGAPKE